MTELQLTDPDVETSALAHVHFGKNRLLVREHLLKRVAEETLTVAAMQKQLRSRAMDIFTGRILAALGTHTT